MCCCIPLRNLSYFGAVIHMGIGIYFLYLLGAVSYALYSATDVDEGQTRRYMGFMYMAYYAVFLPPGIFIFWGVQKKLRRFLVWPPLAFLLVQLYSIGLQSTYGYRPQSVPDALKHHGQVEQLKKLRIDFWMNVFIQLTMTLAYLFLLFFYYREIGQKSAPVQSRYAQYPYVAQTIAAVTAHQQHQQQQAATLALHKGRGEAQQGGSGQPHPTQPAPPPPNQTPQPPQLPQHLSHLAIFSNQAVAYHPVNVVSVGSPPPTSMPMAISPATSGPIVVIPGLPSRTSSSNTVPQGVPPINLGTLASLSYEQQQQILKFHQQQIMLQQHHHHQQQQQQQHQQMPHSSQIEHELQQQILQQFPAYAALLGANQHQPGKSPKY